MNLWPMEEGRLMVRAQKPFIDLRKCRGLDTCRLYALKVAKPQELAGSGELGVWWMGS